MRIIQSFWTLPLVNNQETTSNNRLLGGWLDSKYHLMSWTYSCLQLRAYYEDVELITDSAGKELLIDELQLPYTSVSIALDNLNEFNSELWALGKMYTLSLQDKPFIHVDGDVFIWQKFDHRIEQADLVAQNVEFNFSFYRKLLDELRETEAYIPTVILDNFINGGYINAYNAGIIGGTQISFLKEYASEAFKFAQRSHGKLNTRSLGMFNAVFEQHLYYCLSDRANLKVRCYLETADKKEINYQIKSLTQFRQAPESTKYIHLFGEDSKRNLEICEELARRLKCFYPSYYDRCECIDQKRKEPEVELKK